MLEEKQEPRIQIHASKAVWNGHETKIACKMTKQANYKFLKLYKAILEEDNISIVRCLAEKHNIVGLKQKRLFSIFAKMKNVVQFVEM
jgi:hypothetical protein